MISPLRTLALAAAAVSALAAASPSPAPNAAGGGTPESTINGYRVETDITDWNANTGNFTMPKEVRISRPGSDARGDKAHGNTKNGTFVLIGNVVAHDSGGAPEAKEAGAGADYNGPATLTCNTLTIDSKKKIYDAVGDVHFEQGTRTAVADHGILNQTTHELHLDGNVRLADGPTTFRAAVVDYNLQTREMHSTGSPVVIREPVPTASPGPPAAPGPSARPRRRL